MEISERVKIVEMTFIEVKRNLNYLINQKDERAVAAVELIENWIKNPAKMNRKEYASGLSVAVTVYQLANNASAASSIASALAKLAISIFEKKDEDFTRYISNAQDSLNHLSYYLSKGLLK